MDQEKVFGEILETKEAYWDYNDMGLKRTPKISILPKGLVQDFCLNFKLFHSFLLMKNGWRKSVWWSSRQKKSLFRL